jgi:glyoxylase-like metal-dependent hydrolase (beta-lactamase superfamily II)
MFVSLCCDCLGVAQGAPVAAVSDQPATHVTTGTQKDKSLQVFTHVAPLNSFGVTSTLVYGPTEAILIDTQFRMSEASALADQIMAKGKKLKAIFITHPDEDHYLGTAVLHQRFPDTPIYMTADALTHFQKVVAKHIAGAKQFLGADAPDAVPTPELLPSTHLVVDGQSVEIIPDLQGDVLDPTNSFVWVPAIRTVIAGDIAFNYVHVYLGDSTEESRQRWQDSIRRIQSLHPQVVIAGHKKSADVADTPQVLIATSEYLKTFDAARKSASDAKALVDSIKQKYPDYGSENLLVFSAARSFKLTPEQLKQQFGPSPGS